MFFLFRFLCSLGIDKKERKKKELSERSITIEVKYINIMKKYEYIFLCFYRERC